MSEKKRVAPYLSEPTIKFLDRVFESSSNGATIICCSFQNLYTQSLHAVKMPYLPLRSTSLLPHSGHILLSMAKMFFCS